jgi:hypothetical protein
MIWCRDQFGYSTGSERVIHFLSCMKRTHNGLSHVAAVTKINGSSLNSLILRYTLQHQAKFPSKCCFGSLADCFCGLKGKPNCLKYINDFFIQLLQEGGTF